MNYTLMPSLEHIALVKIATTLWNQDDIRALIARFGRREKWPVIEDKVMQKVPLLSQPGPLKEEILDFVELLGLQILKWMEYLDENCFVGKNLPKDLCWTPQGTVDEKKAAEVFIKDESLDITRRYKLACLYCLEDDIPGLWNKIPENHRKSFYSEDPRQVRQEPLVILWTYDIKGEVARMDSMFERKWQRKCSIYQFAFEYAAVNNNKVATKYFLQKLTPTEREESLVRSIEYLANRLDSGYNHHTDRSDVLCFLLSQMDEEQQIEVFKNHHYTVLNCLLDWPWQSFFMEAANCMWDFLSGEDYYYLLSTIIYKVIDGCKGCNYQNLFGEFWKQSPSAHKRYVVNECAIGFLLSILFEIEDEKNIKLILKDASLTEKKKFIFSKGKDICQNLIYNDKWELLKFFVQECISSRNEMAKFKEEFKKHKGWYCSKAKIASNKDKWNKFFQLLDDLIYKYDENRDMQEDGSNAAKGLHGTEFTEETSGAKK